MKVPPIGSKERKDLIDFICLLWYKTVKPAKRLTSFVTLARIKRFVGLSERTISDLCKEREADLNRNQRTITRNKMDKYVTWVKRDRRKKVTIALRKLATREDTLKRMVGMNLSERCILLHRLMPDVMIKKTTLARIYKEHKIRYKLVRKMKVVPVDSKEFVRETIANNKSRIN